MEPVKPWYTSKTILVNIAMGLAMVVAEFQPEVANIMKESFGAAGLGWAFLNIILRFVTKTGVQIG